MWDEPRGADGKRRQRKKGGFATRKEAQAHLTQVLASLDKNAYIQPERMTVGEYLNDVWLPTLTVRPSTRRAYESHVRIYFVPRVGHIPLQRLSRADLRSMFADLARAGVRRPLSAATLRRVHATIRVALNAALIDDLILRNPAVGLRLEVPAKPQINVWSAEELRQFLTGIEGDPLHPVYFFIAMTGVRRGEAAGLKWSDVDLTSGRVAIRRQISQRGRILEEGEPKTRSGSRSVAIDPRTRAVLGKLRARQAKDKLAWGAAYVDNDLVFARENGSSVGPDHISDHFDLLVQKNGLRRIRLHDLRHTHATLMLSAGVPAKAVSERLGHSSIALTLDTYSHVLPALGEEAALRTAEAVFGSAVAGA
jgi:integrase